VPGEPTGVADQFNDFIKAPVSLPPVKKSGLFKVLTSIKWEKFVSGLFA
jgi:hypothetical protein